MASALDPETRRRAEAHGWIWDNAWNSWKCPDRNHLVADRQIGVDPTRRCWICECEDDDARRRPQAPPRAMPLRTEIRIDAPRFDEALTNISTRYLSDTVFPAVRQPKRRPIKAEPEPTLTHKGRRYDLDEE